MGWLIDFAAEFEHELVACKHPLYVIKNGKKVLGYFHACQPVLIYPSIHPHCTPREVYDLGNLLAERAGKNGGALTPIETKFTPRIMEKLGFHPTNLLLYTTQPSINMNAQLQQEAKA